MMCTEREKTAYHEAAHAIMASALLGYRVGCVTAIPDNEGRLGRVGELGLFKPCYIKDRNNNKETKGKYAKASAIVLLAGPLAESMFSEQSVFDCLTTYGADDKNKAEVILDLVCEDVENEMDNVFDETDALLRTESVMAAISQVATCLISEDSMNGNQIEEIMENTKVRDKISIMFDVNKAWIKIDTEIQE